MERDHFEKDATLRDIFDHMGDAVYFVDDTGAILFMNRAAEKLDGLRFSDVRGRTIMDVYNLTAAESPLLRVVCNKEPLQDHFFRYYINDQEVYQICNTFPVRFADGYWGAFSVQRDVTLFKKTIDRNIELQKQLFGSGRGRGEGSHGLCTFDDIIGDHESLRRCKEQGAMAAQSDSMVMLTGLTGTGKELFAQSIHAASKRADKPFLAVNCAAIPESLLEGILFGTVKGVYTGALDRKGLFEEADGGTLFLDEINSMPLTSQAKLLRVLEDKVVQPLGGKERIRVDTRIISSCNEYPGDVLRKKQIRGDLFYRLAVVNILIPPLRERKSDIYLLAHYFITEYNRRLGKNVLCIEDEMTGFFLDYDWPGNVRQLKHCIECAMNQVGPEETAIRRHHLPFYLFEEGAGPGGGFYQGFQTLASTHVPREPEPEPEPVLPPRAGVLAEIRRQEREQIVAALRESNGNVAAASRKLGLSRQTLVYRMKKHNIR